MLEDNPTRIILVFFFFSFEVSINGFGLICGKQQYSSVRDNSSTENEMVLLSSLWFLYFIAVEWHIHIVYISSVRI